MSTSKLLSIPSIKKNKPKQFAQIKKDQKFQCLPSIKIEVPPEDKIVIKSKDEDDDYESNSSENRISQFIIHSPDSSIHSNEDNNLNNEKIVKKKKKQQQQLHSNKNNKKDLNLNDDTSTIKKSTLVIQVNAKLRHFSQAKEDLTVIPTPEPQITPNTNMLSINNQIMRPSYLNNHQGENSILIDKNLSQLTSKNDIESISDIKFHKKSMQRQKIEKEGDLFNDTLDIEANKKSKGQDKIKGSIINGFKFNKVKSSKDPNGEQQRARDCPLENTIKEIYNQSKIIEGNNTNNTLEGFESEPNKMMLQQEMKQLCNEMGITNMEIEQNIELIQKMMTTDLGDSIVKEIDHKDRVIYFNKSKLTVQSKHPFFNKYLAIFQSKSQQQDEELILPMKRQKGIHTTHNPLMIQRMSSLEDKQQQHQISDNKSNVSSQSSNNSFSNNQNNNQQKKNKNNQVSKVMSSNSKIGSRITQLSKRDIIFQKSNKKSLHNPPEFSTIIDKACPYSQQIT